MITEVVMFAIQYLDHDEGSCARWNDLAINHFSTRDEARIKLREIQAKDELDEYLSYSYRITEVAHVGSRIDSSTRSERRTT